MPAYWYAWKAQRDSYWESEVSLVLEKQMIEHLPVYGTTALSYIGLKIVASTRYEPIRGEGNPSVSVIIPEYNEDPELFERGLNSLLGQEYPLEEILVVDDGSVDTRAWEVAEQYSNEYELITATRLPENRGKRHAQAEAFRKAQGEVYVTMDSDTIVKPNSIRELVKPFSDEDVMATTGYPTVVNRNNNLLTRLIDMRYHVAFNIERAAQSVNGTVVCCCGVLSAYRASLVDEVLEDYTTQTFLGEECTFGDDRRLTAYALKRGKVLYQSTAVSETDAPEGIKQYLTQQTRWMRSFWRESILALPWAVRRSPLLGGMMIVDLLLPFLLLTVGFGYMFYLTLSTDMMMTPLYLLVITGVAYLRNMSYMRKHKGTFMLSPVYAALYLTMLLPLSFYALATINSTGWGTR